MLSYARRDLLRNPRRTIASLLGVLLGVGLFSGVLFFVDGSGASMTDRALAPVAIDMQRVATSPLGDGVTLEQHLKGGGGLQRGERTTMTLTARNLGTAAANEVLVKDSLPAELSYVPGSARRDGRRVADVGGESPFYTVRAWSATTPEPSPEARQSTSATRSWPPVRFPTSRHCASWRRSQPARTWCPSRRMHRAWCRSASSSGGSRRSRGSPPPTGSRSLSSNLGRCARLGRASIDRSRSSASTGHTLSGIRRSSSTAGPSRRDRPCSAPRRPRRSGSEWAIRSS